MKIFIGEIQTKIEKLRKTASEKEIIFFEFLSDQKITIKPTSSSSDILQVCNAAFTENKSINDGVIKKIQQEKPIKGGIHYSNNIIELCAIGKLDYLNEQNHIKEFKNKGSAKERYIISIVFPEINYDRPDLIENVIDVLVQDILIDKNFDDSETKLLNALNGANDLLDLYIINSSYIEIAKQHPIKTFTKYLEYLIKPYLIIYDLLKICIRSLLTIMIFIIFVLIIVYASKLIIPSYSKYEGILYVFGVSLQLLVTFIFFTFDNKFTKKKIRNFIFNKTTEYLCKLIFGIFRINLEEVKNINKYIKQNGLK